MLRAQALLRLASTVAALLCAAPLFAASRFDPALRFRTLTTEHFVIYFHRGEERLAARLAAIAEETRSTLAPNLGVPVQRRTHVVIADQSELANGWASPVPYNTIVINAASPSGSEAIGLTHDWLRLVFTHEYAHIVHLDRSGGWARFVRAVFGRTPLAFPNLFLPAWQIEGIATLAESLFVTPGGRALAGDFRVIEREAARRGRLEPIDRINGGLTSWPNGHAPYAYGLGFHYYLGMIYQSRTFDPNRFRQLIDNTARRVPFWTSGVYASVFGKPLDELWDDYQATLKAEVGSSPIIEATRLTHHGHTVVGPRFRRRDCPSCPLEVVYSVRTPHAFPTLNVVALDGSPSRPLTTRYLGSTTGIGRDVLVYDQQELHRSVGLYSDLFTLDSRSGNVVRLTEGARLVDPDLSPDGETIVAAREGLGRRELVTVRMNGSSTALPAVVLVSEADTQFSTPRWSPDGKSIAVERKRRGRMSEIVIVEVATGSVRVVAAGAAIGSLTRFVTPAWRPDGRALVVAGGGEGPENPFNLFEVDIEPNAVSARFLTNTTGGATWPDVSPDGTTLVFTGYTTDGYDLFSMPYPSPTSSAERAIDLTPTGPAPESAAPAETGPYNPMPTLAPAAWSPVVELDDDNWKIGAGVSGYDVLAYHSYGASATWRVNVPSAVVAAGTAIDWNVFYAYDRWRPTFFGSASAETAFLPVTFQDHATPSIVAVRSRELEAGLTIPFRRVRIAHRAFVSVLRNEDRYELPDAGMAISRTAVRAGWSTSSARTYGFSISPEDGIAIGGTVENAPAALGSTGSATAATADLRLYLRGVTRHHVVAIRGGAGLSNGEPLAGRTFRLGGSSAAGAVLNFDADAFSLLRAFETNAFVGRRVALLNADYRWPLAAPQRGFRTWPVFLHTVHAAVFNDIGHAWSGAFDLDDLKTAFGAEVSADVVAGYSLRLTVTAGAAWGRDGATRENARAAYLRIGRAF
jgi:hypothetical protein